MAMSDSLPILLLPLLIVLFTYGRENVPKFFRYGVVVLMIGVESAVGMSNFTSMREEKQAVRDLVYRVFVEDPRNFDPDAMARRCQTLLDGLDRELPPGAFSRDKARLDLHDGQWTMSWTFTDRAAAERRIYRCNGFGKALQTVSLE